MMGAGVKDDDPGSGGSFVRIRAKKLGQLLIRYADDNMPRHLPSCGTEYRGCDPQCTYQEQVL